jgi:hypothetical protein
VYGNEVIIPNTSAVKQYRKLKLDLYSLKIKSLSYLILSFNKKKYNYLKLNLTKISRELSNFSNLLVFSLSFKHKYFIGQFNDLMSLNFFISKKFFFKLIN